ncbi:DUF4328 domain-containing protein [Embleya sp. NBC_00896]|uniref:DUF4328 domain-containing protein n=1 Tax=Embleya sp. NBC_00896 TaxID=2975961 RepID=UPI00386D5692|nr:DUF4328 domain-containing protein [Embleya sp. NBC_00896]
MPEGAYAGAYPHATGQFSPQAPYGMPGPYPVMPYPGALHQPFRALRGLALTLYILLPLCAVFAALCAAAFFHRADVLQEIVDAGDRGMTDALRTRAEDSDALVAAAIAFLTLSMIASGVLFIIWMYRARMNVDLFGPSKQHLSAGWTIGGWLVPLVNLWFPKLILHDVWRASDPRTAERGGKTPGRVPLLWSWWVLLVGSAVLFFASRLSYPMDEDIELSDADRLRTIDILSGVADIVLILAAVAAILVVRKITTFQHEREAMAFASGAVPGAFPAGIPTGAPTPWAAYPPQAPTAQYYAPPVPTAPGAPGVPPVPQAPVAPAAPDAAASAAAAPAADAVRPATPVQAPPPRPANAPTAAMPTPPGDDAASAEPVSLTKPAEADAVEAADAEAEPDADSVVETESETEPEPEPEADAKPAPEPEANDSDGSDDSDETNNSDETNKANDANTADEVEPIAPVEPTTDPAPKSASVPPQPDVASQDVSPADVESAPSGERRD